MKKILFSLCIFTHLMHSSENTVAVAFNNYSKKELYCQINDEPKRVVVKSRESESSYFWGLSSGQDYASTLIFVKPTDRITLFYGIAHTVGLTSGNADEDSIMRISPDIKIEEIFVAQSNKKDADAFYSLKNKMQHNTSEQ